MPVTMNNIEEAMDTNELAAQTASVNIANTSWLESSILVEKIKNLKDLCIGNCRLLYGSERFKFYDVVICSDEVTNSYGAVLTCNQDGHTKLLRTVSSHCPVKAVRELVDGLQKDTAKLFTKYTVGSQLEGQQGYTNKETGEFVLSGLAADKRVQGPDDDTVGLVRSWSDAPGGLGRRGNKRRAVGQLDKPQVEGNSLDYGEL